MRNVVIVDGLRTPFGRLGGGLRQFYNSDMGAMVIQALLKNNALDAKEVDAVYYGSANGDILCNNTARYTALKAGLPYECSAVAVEMQCGSGIAALNHAAYRILNNDADVILVLKDGVVIESGSHDELMAMEGFYHSLFFSQFKG